MRDNPDGQRDAATARRALRLDNATPMAARFDPRLPGFAMPHGADALRPSTIPAIHEVFGLLSLATVSAFDDTSALRNR